MHVAGSSFTVAQPMGDALAPAAHREQIDRRGGRTARAAPAELPTSSESGVITASMTPISSLGVSGLRGSCPRASASSLLQRDDAFERRRLALQDQHRRRALDRRAGGP